MKESLEKLAAVALLGTHKVGAIPPLDAPGRLAESLARLAGRDPERHLLDAAAIVATARRAGFVAPRITPPPETTSIPYAPPEPHLLCPPAAAATLRRILSGEHADLLDQWLRHAADRNLLAPPDALPDMLTAAKNKPDLRDAAAKVIGERGRWLARQNPDWAFASGAADADDAEERWQTGTPQERLSALLDLRRKAPAQAIALLQSTWTTDPPDQRARFVEALRVNLSMDDELFLEAALDDKRKPVRAAAADLLSRLPSSRLVVRMLERLEPLLDWTPSGRDMLSKLTGRATLSVTIPRAFTKEMARDGVDEKPPAKIGEGAWWLASMLAAVPPSHWCRRWNATPDDLVAAALATDWAGPLLHGWFTAAMRSLDAAWATALCQPPSKLGEGSAQKLLDILNPFASLHDYLAALPAAAREPAVAAGVAAAIDAGDPMHAIALLRFAPAPWGPDLSMIGVAVEPPKGGTRYSIEATARAELAHILAAGVHPDAGRAAVARIEACFAGDQGASPARPLDTLDFRLRMHQEFNP